jgi:heparinase II/III-like protein
MKYWHILRCMGVGWLSHRGLYSLKLKSGWFKRRCPCISWKDRPLSDYLDDQSLSDPDRYLEYRRISAPSFLFAPSQREVSRDLLLRFDTEIEQGGFKDSIVESDNILAGKFRYFSHHEIKAGFPPDWFHNPFQSGADYIEEDKRKHWSEIDDFSLGDIKAVWELSRFSFVYTLVRAYWRTGDEKYSDGFWKLIENWRSHNFPQAGPHWKCGQEIAFRIMAWTFGLYGFLDAESTTPERVIELSRMIAVAAKRIEENISYALSQKNNHSISEALGLWTVGLLFPEFSAAHRWKERGRKILEDCAVELIYPDGTFSQHSSNYHRLMLHDYLWILALANKNRENFSKALAERVKLAGSFLASIIYDSTGRVPNLGANDGSLILPLTDCDYLDYRPVLQAIRVLLDGEPEFPPGPWNEALFWLGLSETEYTGPEDKSRSVSELFEDGGSLVLRGTRSRAVIHCVPRFLHRPSHADQLHIDLWFRGINILRDSGTYSYNASPGMELESTAAHNTIEFDGRDQMPRLSRFLFGAWTGVRTIEPLVGEDGLFQWEGGYSDWLGGSHKRRVELDKTTDTWTIIDRVSGYKKKAILRWRLAPELNWRLDGNRTIGDGVEIVIRTDDTLSGVSLVEGWESLYYFEKKKIPVLAVEMRAPYAEVKTEIRLIS